MTWETVFRGRVELGCGYSVPCEAKLDSFEKDLPEPNVGDTVQVEIYFSSNEEPRFPTLYAHYIKMVARKEEASAQEKEVVVPKPEKSFVYSNYWHTWSRLLSDNHPDGPFVEVDLTPTNSHHDSSKKEWAEKIASIHIRKHGTSKSEKDERVAELPSEVKAIMVSRLGAELTERLLTEDFLSQIDWDLYKQKCNGGASLNDIRRTS
jgi:hypothetical protein